MTSSAHARRRRGEPILVLLVIAFGWATVRAFAWQSPFPPEHTFVPKAAAAAIVLAGATPPERPGPDNPVLEVSHSAARFDDRVAFRATPVSRGEQALAGTPGTFARTPSPASVPPALFAPEPPLNTPGQVATPARAVRKRLHVDGWVAWRPNGSAPLAAGGPLAATYGASQSGLLARYDLSSGPRPPQAYLRALHAPEEPGQSDLAVGFGARPLPRIPLRLQAEARATRSQGQTFVRPALLAVTELAPIALPLGLRAEGYAQGGWVGGRYATGFVDGQARVDRELVAAGPARLRLGAGAWGGAQKGAARLDLGPALTLDLRDSVIPARLSLDYRHQVAGKARPGSGVAVTLSTGF